VIEWAIAGVKMTNSDQRTMKIRLQRELLPESVEGDLVAAVIDAAARASGSYLGLHDAMGPVHTAGTRPEGLVRSTSFETPDGTTLTLEGDLDPERLQAVATLVREAAATHLQLSEARTDLGRSRKELSLLFEFSQSVCRVSTVEQVVERFLVDVVSVLDAEEGTLLALDEKTQELYILCHHGSTPDTVANFRLPLGQGIAGMVALDGRPRLVNDTTRDPDYVAGANPIRNVICVPIRIGGAVAGVVSVNDRRNGEPFEPSHLRLLSSLAQLGEIGLENARLYSQIRGLLFETVDGLVCMMEARAPHTVGHSRRVARLAYSLGRRLEMSQTDLERLYLAALIHDLGAAPPQPTQPDAPWSGRLEIDTIDQPDEDRPSGVLRVKGRLAELLPGLEDHQERHDGTGQPKGLASDAISLQGRIIAVAHAFDGATHTPQWQKASTPAQALEAIRAQAGTALDPGVVRKFTEVYDLLRLENWVPPAGDDVPWKSTSAVPITDEFRGPFEEPDDD
jgi:HD-GYP domain-containing protein (c-di-GMP phosphodiesterase class II)